MESIISNVKKAFMAEFIKLSPKTNEIAQISWFLFMIGGSVRADILKMRFPDVEKDLENMIEMNIIRHMGGGDDDVIVFTENFESSLLKKNLDEISFEDIYDALVEGHGADIGNRYKLDDFIDGLSAVLATIVINATPEEPAFLNKVLRDSSSSFGGEPTPESVSKAKNMLEYYLFKYLGLVQPIGSFAVNLTPKGVDVVKRHPELLDVYTKGRRHGEKQSDHKALRHVAAKTE